MKHKILIGVATFLMFAITTLGYAELSDSLSIDGSVSADAPEPINDIYISDVTVADGTNAEIRGYVQTVLSSTVTLGGSGSSATLYVTIINNSSVDKVFNRVAYSSDAYSNAGITFTLNGIQTGDKVAHDPSDPTHVVTFEVIFTYADGVTADPTLESVLLFEFADAADWEEPGGGDPGGGDEPGGDEPGGDEPGGDEPGGGGTVVAGEDFAALIEAAMSDIRGDYGLNDPHKGNVIPDNITAADDNGVIDGIIYSSDNLQGGHIKHFASETRNTHNLDFVFEYVTDTEYHLYMWRLADLEGTTPGTTTILVYKQVYHEINGTWEKSTTMAGHSIVQSVTNNQGDDIIAINPSEWEVGEPHN